MSGHLGLLSLLFGWRAAHVPPWPIAVYGVAAAQVFVAGAAAAQAGTPEA